MPDFATLQGKKAELLRKGLEGSVFVAERSAAKLDVASLFDSTSGELQALPSGHKDVGYTSDDGAQWSRSVDTSDITSWGTTETTRSDITSDVTTLQLACQETNAVTIAQYMGIQVSSMTPAANGALMVPKPNIGTAQYRQVWAIAVDIGDGGEIYIIRYLPRAKVTDYDDSPFANGDDPIMWPVTYTGYHDSELGYSDALMFGGPGWLALQAAMGFSQVSVSPASMTLTASSSETQQLTVTADGADVTGSALFTSSDSSVATVSSSGLVTAVASGTTTVTATYEGGTAESTVTVT